MLKVDSATRVEKQNILHPVVYCVTVNVTEVETIIFFHLYQPATHRAVSVSTFQHYAQITVHCAYFKDLLAVLEVVLPFNSELVGS